jgi:hypothetical protein
MKKIASVLFVFITTPIWYYLLYQILKAVEATELMWFLFWVYVPVGLFVSFILKVAQDESEQNDKKSNSQS